MQEKEVLVDETRAVAAVRSGIYRALSQVFFFPKTLSTAEFLAPRLAELRELARSLDDQALAGIFAESLQGLDEIAVSDGSLPLADAYTALFDNCTGRAAVSMYEKDYGNGDAKMIWEEAIRFYEHFGLNFDVRVTRDWPDHIGTELEFMHYLTYLEAVAEDDGEALRQAQGDFLTRRLARWAPRFAGQLEKRLAGGIYHHFARMIAAFVAADTAYLGHTLDALPPWVPQNEAQSGSLAGKTWIPIVEASEIDAFTY